MKKEVNSKEIRIQLICKKLIKGASLDDIIDYVNKTFSERGFDKESFSKRTIQSDIQSIREGDFNYINKTIKQEKNKNGFEIKYNRADNCYYFTEESNIPEFDSLDDDERMTLPFLIGILNPYQNIPAVKKILLELGDTFYIEKNELKSANAIVIPRPTLINEEKVIKLVLKILGHISKKECIEFHYNTVHKLDESLNSSSYHKIIPLQIRLFENIYYLIGYNKILSKISNYRLDQILNFRVDIVQDENTDEIEYFDDNFIKNLQLNKYFENTIGVWCHEEIETVETVKIVFKNWAASYIKRLPIHHTQKIINTDLINIEITIEITIKLYPKTKYRTTTLQRSNELAFLLGRFREFCEVIENN
jgi:predicted DNA-binding transcriptional regulator YafY